MSFVCASLAYSRINWQIDLKEVNHEHWVKLN
jgi:hypothetical protein